MDESDYQLAVEIAEHAAQERINGNLTHAEQLSALAYNIAKRVLCDRVCDCVSEEKL